MTDERTLALEYAELARLNYERDGELAPILAIQAKHQVAICLMNGGESLALSYGRTLLATAAILQPEFVITVHEMWMQKLYFDSEEKMEAALALAEAVQRGELEQRALAGDSTVHTALVTTAWTMDPRRAVSVYDIVLDDGTYDRDIQQGEQQGNLVECIIGGWQQGLTLPAPPMDLSPEQIAAIISIAGEVAAVVFEPI